MFDSITKDLRTVYGAESVARWGLLALLHKKKELDATCEFVTTYIAHLKKACKTLELVRPEPFLQNIFNYILSDLPDIKLPELKKEISRRIQEMQTYLEETDTRIAEIGSRKIKKNATVFTQGYSTSVERILFKAHEFKIKFNVTVIETLPLHHGKIIAESLAKLNIPVTYFLDVSINEAIKVADIVLLGCVSIDEKGCYHRAGARTTAELAKIHKKPLYICADLFKRARKKKTTLPKLSQEDLWKAPKGVTLYTDAFDCIPHTLITGIICEEGILSPEEYLTL